MADVIRQRGVRWEAAKSVRRRRSPVGGSRTESPGVLWDAFMDFGCFSLIAGRFSCDPGTFLGSGRGFHGPRMPFRAATSGLSLEGSIGNGAPGHLRARCRLRPRCRLRAQSFDERRRIQPYAWKSGRMRPRRRRPAPSGLAERTTPRRKPISSPPPAGPGTRRRLVAELPLERLAVRRARHLSRPPSGALRF